MTSPALPTRLAARALREAPRLEGERKQVTVLFADLVGSTRLASELDPEDMMELLNAVFSRWVDEVHAYEGMVDKFLGDGMLALFGAPLLHEDDPQRAVRAALGIVGQTAALAAELEAMGWPSVAVRVGLNTGTVVVGNVGSDARMEYTAVGDVVNLAQRVESAARPGSVYITAATDRLVAPYFDVADIGTHELKGVAGEIRLFEVVADRQVSHAVRGVEGLASPLVGRDAEFKVLGDAVDQLGRQVGASVVLVAEAGLGKSRLVSETLERARRAGLPTATGHAISYGRLTPYLPIIELVETLDPHGELIRRLFGDGVDDVTDEGHHRRNVQGVCRLVARAAPIVVAVEDLHWADEASLDVVQALADIARDAGFLLLATARPEPSSTEFFERLPDTDVLSFGPLDPVAGQDLLDAMLGQAVDPDLTGRLLETSAGNPFYLEELVRNLIDQGRLARTAAGWEVEVGTVVSLPPTLEGLLGSRIDRLAPEPKRLLRSAAVIGRDVPTVLLEAVEPDLFGHLPTLVGAGFLIPTADGHRFRHVLTQEAAYRALLRRQRRAVHRRAAEAIEALYADDLEAHAAELGRHYDAAGDVDRARHHLSVAGRRAAAGYANDAARTLLTRALELTDDVEARMELLDLRAAVSARIGDHEAEAADIDEMVGIAESTGLGRHRLTALVARARHLATVDHPNAPDVAEEALALAESLRHRRHRARLLHMLGTLALGEYSPERAIPLLEEAAAVFGDEGLLTDQANALTDLARCVALVDPEGATEVAAQAAEAADSTGDPVVQASVRLQFAALALGAGDATEAADHLQVAATLAEAAGDRRLQMRTLLRRHHVATIAGDEEAADRFALDVMGLAERHREWLLWLFGAMSYVEGLEAREDVFTLWTWLTGLVAEMGPRLPLHPRSYLHYALGYRTARWLGAFDQAVDELSTAQRLADQNAWPPAMVMYRNGIATCLLERGEVADARQEIDEASTLATEHRTAAMTGAYVEITDARVASAEGDLDRARRLIGRLEAWTEGREAVGERHAAALLGAELALLEGDPVRAVQQARAAIGLDPQVRRHTRWFTILQCLDLQARALEAAGHADEAATARWEARAEAERRLARLSGTPFVHSYVDRPEVRRALDL